ncbi:MAG: ABC transporter permease [Deltaproteobacteria bacterium]|jgi:NitT/TauT family transport system permease protein|nr:ABC transporter permease [Deltaproteobacteria bacterium]
MSWYGIIAFLVLWQVAPYVGLADGRFIPPLSVVIIDALKLVGNGQIFIHAATSTQRVLLGLIAAIVVAIPSAVVLAGWFPRLTKFMGPLLQLLGNINPFALFPLFILLFGVGELAKFAIMFWSSLFPILNTTIGGVQNIEPILLKTARSMGATKAVIFRKVVLPGALPSIFTGLRMGATTAFLFLIAAEMLSASAGMGWLIHNSSMNNYIPRISVSVVGIALLGMLISLLINKLESFFLDFKEEAKV